ncbi:hypothetical protein RV12_GL001286 [Enterococcus quebecensis]|nr:hypothetical protein RV12_GL001286 [Enterococcus quebecensis]
MPIIAKNDMYTKYLFFISDLTFNSYYNGNRLKKGKVSSVIIETLE